jgi:hypothetical protein
MKSDEDAAPRDNEREMRTRNNTWIFTSLLEDFGYLLYMVETTTIY